jgi:hypothetical protein
MWTKNNGYWNTRNSHIVHKVQLCDVKVGVWCALSARKIMGSVFYAHSINSERCLLQGTSNLHCTMLHLQLTKTAQQKSHAPAVTIYPFCMFFTSFGTEYIFTLVWNCIYVLWIFSIFIVQVWFAYVLVICLFKCGKSLIWCIWWKVYDRVRSLLVNIGILPWFGHGCLHPSPFQPSYHVMSEILTMS